MPVALDLKARGLYTHQSPLTSPQGALLIADNVVIDREDTTETRRGLKQKGTSLTLGVGEKINKFFNYNSRLLVSYGSKMAYDSDGSLTWSDYSGTYVAPTGAKRIRSAQANKNFYFTTNAGIKKLDAYNGAVKMAGMYKGLDGSGALNGSGSWFTTNAQVAYRIVFGIKDANNNKIIGAPSQRIIVANSSGSSKGVDLTFTLPSGITTSHFYQVYRSGLSATSSDEPNDEVQLIVENSPTAGEVTALSVTYSDLTPDSLRGASLYTNPSQQGILQANEPPPLAQDIATYKNQTLYANTITKHRLNITLISTGGTGFVIGDTITIAGVVYTGAAAENVALNEFQVFTAGTPAANIDNTARSLIKIINQSASNTTVYAYYLTGFADLPGQILIEERGLGGAQFVAISSRGSAFSPPIPSSGTAYASSNDTSPNRVYISKVGQPEAVPLLNYIDAGSALKNIIRIISLRNSVFILKEDGIFRITGETINDFRISLFDATTTIKCQESAVSFNNQVICFADQGLVTISDSGVAIVSRAIERTLVRLSTSQYTNFDEASFGISYESERKYLFCTVSETDDTIATQQFVYNSLTNTFTRWDREITCGIVSEANDKLTLGSGTTGINKAYEERKDFASTDYADEEYAVNITFVDGLNITLDTVTGLEVGMSLVQFKDDNPIRASIITAINTSTKIVTVTDRFSWPPGPAVVYTPIETTIQPVPIHGGNPATLHHWDSFYFLFSGAQFDSFTVAFTSNFNVGEETVVLNPYLPGWGDVPWGDEDWGGTIPNIQPIITSVPRESAESNWLNVKMTQAQALTAFALVGLAAYHVPVGDAQR